MRRAWMSSSRRWRPATARPRAREHRALEHQPLRHRLLHPYRAAHRIRDGGRSQNPSAHRARSQRARARERSRARDRAHADSDPRSAPPRRRTRTAPPIRFRSLPRPEWRQAAAGLIARPRAAAACRASVRHRLHRSRARPRRATARTRCARAARAHRRPARSSRPHSSADHGPTHRSRAALLAVRERHIEPQLLPPGERRIGHERHGERVVHDAAIEVLVRAMEVRVEAQRVSPEARILVALAGALEQHGSRSRASRCAA